MLSRRSTIAPVAERAAGTATGPEAPDAPAHARAECAHCGLPVPGAAEARGAGDPLFCCAGCETAYAIIRENGLDAYYAFPERRNERVHASGRSFEEFDHATFALLYVRERGDGLSETELYLENVHCASCVWLVERVAIAVPGVASAELDVGRARARIVWDRSRTPLSAIARFFDSLGYVPHPFRGARAERERRAEDRAALVRIGVAGAIAGNVMLIALAIYAGWFGGIDHAFERYFRWWSFALTTPSILWPGRVFFKSAIGALRNRALHMDVPIALALGAGYLHGAVNTVRDAGPIYFDGVATLIFLLLVGRFLQQRAQRAAVDAAELLSSLAPATARVARGEAIHDVPAEAVLPGWIIDVRAGDTIAADGVVVSGSSSVDLSLLTGESRPAPVGPGDEVFAGTANAGAPLRIRVTQTAEASRLGQLLRQVEESARRRSPVVRLADRLAGSFIGVVLVLAVVTAVAWLVRDPSRAMDNAIAMLVVTCPCALALATPLAVTGAIGRAARSGILIRGGDALETLAGRGTLVLDKTGTITEGRLEIVHWSGTDEAKPLVLALERHSRHPIAAAFARAWPVAAHLDASDVRETLGGGISGVVGARRVAIGNAAFVRAHLRAGARAHPSTRPRDGDPALPRAGDARSRIHVIVDGEPAGVGLLGDPVRPEARRAVDALRRAGWRVEVLSGDEDGTVKSAAAVLGVAGADARGGHAPEAKRARVLALLARGPVVMVGDGVNDAAAMAAATVGVGVHGGAEACLATADVFLSRAGLEPLVALVSGARRTMKLVRIGIGASIAYNVVGATLAFTGVINPLVAAVMMPVSSLTVVLIAWQGRTFARTAR